MKTQGTALTKINTTGKKQACGASIRHSAGVACHEHQKSLLATPERARQMGGVVTERLPIAPNNPGTFRRQRAKAECWLDRYHLPRRNSKGVLLPPLLNTAAYDAGVELRKAWLFSLHGIRWSFDSTTMMGTRSNGVTECQIMRLEYSERIIRDFYAAELSTAQKLIIIKVCSLDDSAGSSDAKQILRRGLERMVDYWAQGKPVTKAKVDTNGMATRRRVFEESLRFKKPA